MASTLVNDWASIFRAVHVHNFWADVKLLGCTLKYDYTLLQEEVRLIGWFGFISRSMKLTVKHCLSSISVSAVGPDDDLRNGICMISYLGTLCSVLL